MRLQTPRYDRLEIDVKGGLLPNHVSRLINHPATAVISQGHVEVENDFGEDQTHLGVSKAEFEELYVNGQR